MENVLIEGAMYEGAGLVTVAWMDGRTRDRFQCAYSVN
jgi:hypothetical protein